MINTGLEQMYHLTSLLMLDGITSKFCFSDHFIVFPIHFIFSDLLSVGSRGAISAMHNK